MHDSFNELKAIDDDQSNTVFRDVTFISIKWICSYSFVAFTMA